MRVAVEEIDGVTEASVSLNDGEVVVTLSEDNGVTLRHLREVIRDGGFTPREADVRVRGEALHREDGWFLRVPNSGALHPLVAPPPVLETLEARGTDPVVVQGRIEEGDGGSETPIQVVAVQTG